MPTDPELAWRVRGELGSGAGGVVFEVVSADGRRGALKRARSIGEPRFERERRLLARGLHPAFPAVVDPGGPGWLVMELVVGTPAAALDRPLSPGAAAALGAQLFSALAALHAAGVVHRDVALRNLLVEPAGRLRVLDLGSATEPGAPATTSEGVVVGTGDRASTTEAGPGLDLYAGGGVLLDLLGPGAGGPVAALAHELRSTEPAARPSAAAAAAALAEWAEPGWAPAQTAAASGPSWAAEPAAPRALGRYRIEGVLGRGGMGVVYRGWDLELRRSVAIKTHATGDPRRFEREARAVAAVDHPSVVRILDAGHDEGLAWLALELVEGSTLEQRLAAGTPPVAVAVRWVADVAEGLARAHELGLVHRDVKPSNVLLDATERARLTDFGLARPVAASAELTRVGVLIGTPQYMSPEQADGTPADPRSDVYSLGLVLFEALAGRPAWPGSDTLRLLAERATSPSPAVPTSIPAELRRVVRKAIAARAEDRYPNAGAFADDLRRWERGVPVRAEDVPWQREAAAWIGRNRRSLGSAAAAGAAVLALGLAVTAGSSMAARRAQSARERVAEVAWTRVSARLDELAADGRADEAAALFSATVADPTLAGTRTLSQAWLAEAERRAAAVRFDDAVSAVGQAWLASRPETRGDVLVAMGDALAAAGRWEERTRVADLLERDDPARATAPDGRRLVRDRDAWRLRPGAGGTEPMDALLARLGRATRLAEWDGANVRFVQPPSLGEPGVSWVVDGASARRVRGPELVPDGVVMDLAAFGAAGGWRQGPGHATHKWFGGTRELRVGAELLRNESDRVRWVADDGSSREGDPWGRELGGAGAMAALDVDGDGAVELAVSQIAWGTQNVRVYDPGSGRPRAILETGAGSLAVVRVGARDWLTVAPTQYFRSAIQVPDPDPRPHRGIQVFDVTRPAEPQWSLHAFTECNLGEVELDGDGRADVVGACRGGVVLVRQAANGFEHTVLGGLGLDGLVDADGDGASDLVVSDEAGRRWLLGAGPGALSPRPDPLVVSDPDPSVQAALDLDRIGLRADAIDRLDAVAVMARGTPTELRARALAAERSFGATGEARFAALAAAGGDPALFARAARAQARDHRLPEAITWADRAPPDAIPEAAGWRRTATAPTLRWSMPGAGWPQTRWAGADLARSGADGLSIDAADEREVLRVPVRLVDPEVGFSVDVTLERVEWAGGWSASLETADGRSLGAVRVRGTGGGRSVEAGLRCQLEWDAQERPLGVDLPAPGLAGTFWWSRSSTGDAGCGLDDRVTGHRSSPAWPEPPVDAWWVLRAHAESGAPRTVLRLRSIELRGLVLREAAPEAGASHPAAAVAALEAEGRSDDAAEVLRSWWRTGAATPGFVRTRPHWLAWLAPTDAEAALDGAWAQLYQHVGDPEIDSILAQLGRGAHQWPAADRAAYHATIAQALGTSEAARHHAAVAWAAALGTADAKARHLAVSVALPPLLAQDLSRDDAALAQRHLAEARGASAWPEMLDRQLRATPGLRQLLTSP